MSIISWFKKLFSKTTKWKNSQNAIVQKFSKGKYVYLSTSIVVEDGQNAVIVGKNKVCDIFSNGEFELTPATMPLCAKCCKLNKAKTNPRTKSLQFPTRFEGCILFVNLNLNTLNGISFKNKIRDTNFKGFKYQFNYSFDLRVENIKSFSKNLVGRVQLVDKNVKKYFIKQLNIYYHKILKKSPITINDITSNSGELQSYLIENAPDYSKYGVVITNFSIHSIILPKKIQKRLANNISNGYSHIYNKKENSALQNQNDDNIYYLPNANNFEYANFKELDTPKGEVYSSEQDDNLKQPTYCAYCGEKQFDGAIYCHKCGTKQVSIEENNYDRIK